MRSNFIQFYTTKGHSDLIGQYYLDNKRSTYQNQNAADTKY